MTKLHFTESATHHVDEIHRFIARDSIQAADNVVHAIYAAAELLVRFPRMGHQSVRRNTRMFVLPDYPYLFCFQYLPRLDELRIRAVRHAARRRAVELRDPQGEFRAAVIS